MLGKVPALQYPNIQGSVQPFRHVCVDQSSTSAVSRIWVAPDWNSDSLKLVLVRAQATAAELMLC